MFKMLATFLTPPQCPFTIDRNADRQLALAEELVKLLCSNCLKKPQITAAVHYDFYSSHHYHHHHFHYHCKMHLYHLTIFLTISLDCKIIPCLFQLNFVFFVLAIAFRFSHSVWSCQDFLVSLLSQKSQIS